jgi:hypothetical protein
MHVHNTLVQKGTHTSMYVHALERGHKWTGEATSTLFGDTNISDGYCYRMGLRTETRQKYDQTMTSLFHAFSVA